MFYFLVTLSNRKGGSSTYLIRCAQETNDSAEQEAIRSGLVYLGDEITIVPATVELIAGLLDWYGKSHACVSNSL